MSATLALLTEDTPLVGRIPVRNLWLLMLYASELFRCLTPEQRDMEDNPDDIPDLVAEILVHLVEQRLRRNLTYGYRFREAVLGRVRGRIDLFETERHHLLERGQVACRFDELTTDTPRNRLVRAALQEMARLVRCETLAYRCSSLAASLGRMGVSPECPGRGELSLERFGRHDAEDAPMVAAARLAFDLALLTETAGSTTLPQPDKEISWVRKLFEKGVAGFYTVTLEHRGWKVNAGRPIYWPVEAQSTAIKDILPSMKTDIELECPTEGKRIVIDTKFNAILTGGWYRDETLRSGYLYQIYAYLRSQEGVGNFGHTATGLLLHPAIATMVDESVHIQGHDIRFATVNLASTAQHIREQLLHVVLSDMPHTL